MQLNFSVPFNTQTDASGRGVVGRDGKVREKRKKASGRCQQETSPEGVTVLCGQLERPAIKWTVDCFK